MSVKRIRTGGFSSEGNPFGSLTKMSEAGANKFLDSRPVVATGEFLTKYTTSSSAAKGGLGTVGVALFFLGVFVVLFMCLGKQ